MLAVTAILSCVIKIRGIFKSTKWRHFENVKFEALSARRATITVVSDQNNRKFDKQSQSKAGLAAAITTVSNRKHLTSNEPIQSGVDPSETITVISHQACRRRKQTVINSKDDLLTTKTNHQSEKRQSPITVDTDQTCRKRKNKVVNS